MNATQQQVTEIIPHGDALANVESGLAKLSQLNAWLDSAEHDASTLQIGKSEDRAFAGELLVAIKGNEKEAEAALGEQKRMAKRALDYVNGKIKFVTDRASRIRKTVSDKIAAYDAQEREAAAKEQSRMPEGTHVIPNTPAIPGARKSEVWPVEVFDVDKLVTAFLNSRGERRELLRQAITVDEQFLSAQAKEMKNAVKFSETFPGCSTYKETRYGGK